MQHVVKLWLVGVLTVIAFAIAAVALGFSHKSPTILDNEIQIAALSGYDVTDICAGDLGDVHYNGHCPACNPDIGGVIPNPVGMVLDAEFQFVSAVIAPRESRAVRIVRDPALGLRAPPLV